MFARRDCLCRRGRKRFKAEEIISELCLSAFGIETESAEFTALRDHYTFGAFCGHFYFSRDRERFVLHHHDAVLAQPSHAAE